MTRTRILNNFAKDRSEENKRNYSKQRKYCVSLLRNESQNILRILMKKRSVRAKHFGKPLNSFYRVFVFPGPRIWPVPSVLALPGPPSPGPGRRLQFAFDDPGPNLYLPARATEFVLTGPD